MAVSFIKRLKNIGPGAMVAAAFIGPGTVTTATISGASFGYTLLWAILFSVGATLLLQEMSARLGVISQMGVGEAIRKKATSKISRVLFIALVVGAIVIGNAAYEAGNLTGAVLGFESYTKDVFTSAVNPLLLLIGVIAFLLLYSGKYKTIERSLVVMVSVMGAVFLLSAIALRPDLAAILKGLFVPALPDGSLIMVIGLIGTTVVPYNLFLHASSVRQRWTNTPENLSLARWDTALSVIFGGLITMSILISSAAALSELDIEITSGADLALQLEPLLGTWAVPFMGIGFLAAGLSSSVTAPLAAAFAASEVSGWKRDLKGRNFRIIWGLVLTAGIVFSSIGFRPTSVILFAQVANGLLLPIVAAFLLWVMNDRELMGDYSNTWLTNILGGIVILITIAIGLRGILSAFSILS